jgi:hypothetical protein
VQQPLPLDAIDHKTVHVRFLSNLNAILDGFRRVFEAVVEVTTSRPLGFHIVLLVAEAVVVIISQPSQALYLHETRNGDAVNAWRTRRWHEYRRVVRTVEVYRNGHLGAQGFNLLLPSMSATNMATS